MTRAEKEAMLEVIVELEQAAQGLRRVLIDIDTNEEAGSDDEPIITD